LFKKEEGWTVQKRKKMRPTGEELCGFLIKGDVRLELRMSSSPSHELTTKTWSLSRKKKKGGLGHNPNRF
jgi:hypothetical protein